MPSTKNPPPAPTDVCRHALYHTDPRSTWAVDPKTGRVVCRVCRRFYGFVRKA